MNKIPTTNLLEELIKLDPRIHLVPNPNRPGLSNSKINGVDMFPVPSDELQDEHSSGYEYTFPNGMSAPHKTYEEAKNQALGILERLKDPEYAKDFFALD